MTEAQSLKGESRTTVLNRYAKTFFVVVGCPVGIWFSRSDFLSSFITCFLPIVFVYYPLMLCGTNMAKEGRFNPMMMVWAANGVIGAVGLVLLAKLARN